MSLNPEIKQGACLGGSVRNKDGYIRPLKYNPFLFTKPKTSG